MACLRPSELDDVSQLINVVYRDYAISGAVLKLIKNRSALTWQKREGETAVERWLQTAANKLTLEQRSRLRPEAKSLIWAAAVLDNEAYQKFDEEMERKSFKGVAAVILTLVRSSIEQRIEVLVDNYSPPVVKVLEQKESGSQFLAYGKWKAKITPRIRSLIKTQGTYRVVASKMFYDAMFPRGSSWSLPNPYRDVLASQPSSPTEAERTPSPPFTSEGACGAKKSFGSSEKTEPDERRGPRPHASSFTLYRDPPWSFPADLSDAPPEAETPVKKAKREAWHGESIVKWTEGFSNPFNSELMEHGHGFCSLWPIVDACFGSSVGFFDLPTLAGSNWCLNPPFVESILADTAKKIFDFYSSPGPHPEKILLLAPRWRDAKFYETIILLPAQGVEVRENESTLSTTGCRDSFLQKSIFSECPVLEFKIGDWRR